MALLYALLGLSIVIAVLGIVNTLGLSIIERTRELGLLRAIALTRPQVRRMITLESVVIALLGAVVGVGLGTVFGMVLQRLLADQGIDRAAVLELLQHALIAPVLTAHPTEVRRKSMIDHRNRIAALMAGCKSIRDVIAFPKSGGGYDPLTDAPAPITPEQRKEAGIDATPKRDEDAEAAQAAGDRAGA